MLGDGVAYAQILDAIHPGALNIFKINLSTRYPDDNLRNIKIVEDGLKKLQIQQQPFSYEKIGKGKFHDNIVFLQWLYGYANRNAADSLSIYQPYQRRLQILERQGKRGNEMNQHLIPNQAYYEEEWEAGVEAEEGVEEGVEEGEVSRRLEHLGEFVRALENDLKDKMELSWRLMHLVDKSIEERNILFSLLNHIDNIVQDSPHSPMRDRLASILRQPPPEFE
jgi:RP/EB family microtubule-associated protein